MLKKMLLPTLLCMSIGSSFASDWETHTASWAEDNPLSTLTFKIKGEDLSTTTAIGAEITHSNQGTQRLYLNFVKMNEADSCDPDNTPNKVTVRVNSQPISMYQTCHLEKGMSLLQTTALSDKGIEFIINAFRNSSDTVRIEYGAFEANLPAIGFTKAWNSAGGDAL
ncbi:hypothetical protein L4D09_28000 [Photobacterium makurazakiensis]|uniref:hypothetical protein n=1 Tax=Photobacterium makurazakiensis TaxID=2910234 RepID=UPI003D0A8013